MHVCVCISQNKVAESPLRPSLKVVNQSFNSKKMSAHMLKLRRLPLLQALALPQKPAGLPLAQNMEPGCRAHKAYLPNEKWRHISFTHFLFDSTKH